MNEIPLFLCGGFITLRIATGVVLAIFELRQAHVPRKPHAAREKPLYPPTPPSS
jgi:hypothetical protein